MSEHLKLNDLEIKYQGNETSAGNEGYANQMEQSIVNPFIRSQLTQQNQGRKNINATLGKLPVGDVEKSQLTNVIKYLKEGIKELDSSVNENKTINGLIGVDVDEQRKIKTDIEEVVAYLESKEEKLDKMGY